MRTGLTIVSVIRTSAGFEWRFRGIKGGARNWREIVDGFAQIAEAVAENAGEDNPLPSNGRLLGQGAPAVVAGRCLRATYRRFRRSEAVRTAKAAESIVFQLDDATKRRVKRTRKGVPNAS